LAFFLRLNQSEFGGSEMTLRECYNERSYYYLKLEYEMNRILGQNGSNSLGNGVIKAFCTGAFGNLQLDSTEDYKNILDVFQCFIAGAAWALRVTTLASTVPLFSGVTPKVSLTY
jgi:hypothetical protein